MKPLACSCCAFSRLASPPPGLAGRAAQRRFASGSYALSAISIHPMHEPPQAETVGRPSLWETLERRFVELWPGL